VEIVVVVVVMVVVVVLEVAVVVVVNKIVRGSNGKCGMRWRKYRKTLENIYSK
jgi:hypothetical protein